MNVLRRFLHRTAGGATTRLAGLAAPPGATVGGVRIVRRNTQPFHEERGWRLRDDELHGYYRTRFGSFPGYIKRPTYPGPQYFIVDPPTCLLRGPHGACFHQRGKREFFVHWNKPPTSIDVGIRRIEHALLEAFQ